MKKLIGLSKGAALITLLIMLSLACNLSGQQAEPVEPAQPIVEGSGLQPAPEQPSAPAQGEIIVETQVVVVTATPEPTEIPSRPVSIREGLNSLNSYKMTIATLSTGPTPQDISDLKVEVRYSSEQDAQETHQYERSSSADDPEISESESVLYRVGLAQCTESDGSYEYEAVSPAQKEMTDLMTEMIDMTPIITDPQFVGAETVNGIETHHFTFQISGLGVGSGAQVVENQGEYWLALDGSYIVKYTLLLETQDNEGQALRFETHIDLSDINLPVEIVMPEGCQP